ncbi:MAG TPA: DUF1778 domain-containing protein [Bryobacteraceae bacterium]|nr:DUF1778 domain-containing protein [Bryobacteraceae bacterium]
MKFEAQIEVESHRPVAVAQLWIVRRHSRFMKTRTPQNYSRIIGSVCAEAEMTIADQRRFSLSAGQWKAFVAALDRPVRAKPRLRGLFAEPSILERLRT